MTTYKMLDDNKRFTPEFSAYTKLVLVNRMQNEHNGRAVNHDPVMTFAEFMSALDENKIVDSHNARNLPEFEKRDDQINAQLNGNWAFERQRVSFIERAYALGMVHQDGTMLTEKEFLELSSI